MIREIVSIRSEPLQAETRADGKRVISGYAIVFNSYSEVLGYGGWRERILPTAVSSMTDFSECICKYNHDEDMLLGSVRAGTLRYSVDDRGVKYEVDIPNTSTGNDVFELIYRKDLWGSSFEFYVGENGADWTEEVIDGVLTEVRIVKNIARVLDMNPVVRPAYHGTDGLAALKRSYEEAKRGSIVHEEPKIQQYRSIEEYIFSL